MMYINILHHVHTLVIIKNWNIKCKKHIKHIKLCNLVTNLGNKPVSIYYQYIRNNFIEEFCCTVFQLHLTVCGTQQFSAVMAVLCACFSTGDHRLKPCVKAEF